MSYTPNQFSDLAIKRIQELGSPKKNNELWTFFPVKFLTKYVDEFCTNQINETQYEHDNFCINTESDIAALLPIANKAPISVKNFAENTVEIGLLKSRSDFTHNVIEIDSNAKVSLELLDNKIAHEICAERYDIIVQKNAELEIFFANPDNEKPIFLKHFRIIQNENSNVRIANVIQNSGIGRISVDCKLNGENAKFDYKNLNILSKNASMHTRLTITHNAPNTVSTQLSRNLLNENSYASYDGQVIVQKNCNKAFSSQLINTILLNEDACVSVKPVLKIYHDDVECTHGNTCGELDSEQMFYMTSRGIPENIAQKMLMQSFAIETFMQMPNWAAKKRIAQVISNIFCNK